MARPRKPAIPPADQRLTSSQVTTEYPIARRTLYQWAADGRITTFKLGSRNLYDRRELDGLIQPKGAGHK